MEIDGDAFVIHLPEDLVKYEIVDGEVTNPIAAIGSLTDLRLPLSDWQRASSLIGRVPSRRCSRRRQRYPRT